MRPFKHINASSIEEAVGWLGRYGAKACIIAGGTDLLGKMKDDVLPKYPEALVNIKTIPGLEYIKEDRGFLSIGALTKLQDIACNKHVQANFPLLAEAALRTASPNIRQMGTIAGNICQDIRCWYYRNPRNRFPCLRKGGGRCYAIEGDNRYHSIFGGSVEGGCYAVHPSDIAPVLIALNAKIKTSKRTIEAESFFQVDVLKTTVLDDDEIVCSVDIPLIYADVKSKFLKFALRKSIDFAIVNCACLIRESEGSVSEARMCLNAVYVRPYRVYEAEKELVGKAINEISAELAAKVSVSGTKPLKYNRYMIQIVRTLVKRAILSCS
jgi:xanthine dehydrogenase YagS FAD-binding subunit